MNDAYKSLMMWENVPTIISDIGREESLEH